MFQQVSTITDSQPPQLQWCWTDLPGRNVGPNISIRAYVPRERRSICANTGASVLRAPNLRCMGAEYHSVVANISTGSRTFWNESGACPSILHFQPFFDGYAVALLCIVFLCDRRTLQRMRWFGSAVHFFGLEVRPFFSCL